MRLAGARARPHLGGMRRCLIIQHAAHEGPGRLLPHLVAAGFAVRSLRLDAGDAVEADVEVEAILIMGGPMGVGDIGDARRPFLAQEVALIRAALTRGVPVAGICLGAQLLAHAAGAAVAPLVLGEPGVRIREVGFGAVHFNPEAATDPLLAGMNAAEVMLHWHGDAFALPPGATWLAGTLHAPQQMFRIGAGAVGVQFHPEVDRAMLETWVQADAGFVRTALGADGAARIRQDAQRLWAGYERAGDRMCRSVVELLRGG